MKGTKITRLKNLMGPLVNYFAIQTKLEVGEYEQKDYCNLHKLLYKDGLQAQKNIKEIRDILKLIPDDAILIDKK